MSTHRHSMFVSLAALALGAVTAACTMGVDEDPAGLPAASEEETPKTMLLALTPIGEEASPILSRVADRFEVVDAAENASLDGALALVADASLLGDDGIAAYRELVGAATWAGVPLVLENVRDPERMAALVGVGFAADAALVEPAQGQPHADITLFGGAAVVEEERASAELVASAGEVAGELGERLALVAEGLPEPRALQLSDHPAGTYWDYLVKRSSPYTWNPGDGDQTATIDVQFQLQLVASVTPAAKFLVVSSAGSGFNPGTMTWNGNKDRGWFQDVLSISISPDSASLSSYTHQPTTPNAMNQYSMSNGCGFNAGWQGTGPVTTFNCSLSTSASTSLTDFTAVDQNAGRLAKWDYRMSYAPGYGLVSGGAYNGWNDLVDPGWALLRNVPVLARSNFVPFFEVVYRAEQDMEGTVPLSLSHSQRMRHTWIDYHFFWSDSYTQSYTSTIPLSAAVNFSRVAIDRLPFVNRGSGLCLDVYGGSTAEGARVIQWPCSFGMNQLFDLVSVPDGSGSVWLKPRHSGLCIGVADGSASDGVRIVQKACSASDQSQMFQLVDSGGGYAYLKLRHSQKCVDIYGGSTSSGSSAVQSTCSGADGQRFK